MMHIPSRTGARTAGPPDRGMSDQAIPEPFIEFQAAPFLLYPVWARAEAGAGGPSRPGLPRPRSGAAAGRPAPPPETGPSRCYTFPGLSRGVPHRPAPTGPPVLSSGVTHPPWGFPVLPDSGRGGPGPGGWRVGRRRKGKQRRERGWEAGEIKG